MRIGELARVSGFPTKTIRYYESLGLLPEPRREPSGYRVYEAHQLRRLEFIRLGKTASLSLTEIADILNASTPEGVDCDHAVELLADKLASVKAQLSELQQLHDALEHTLDAHRRHELRTSLSADDCPVIERAAQERLAAAEYCSLPS